MMTHRTFERPIYLSFFQVELATYVNRCLIKSDQKGTVPNRVSKLKQGSDTYAVDMQLSLHVGLQQPKAAA